MSTSKLFYIFFFFNDTATTEIYTLSLHDALPIFPCKLSPLGQQSLQPFDLFSQCAQALRNRSEEHTSELQSQSNLVCRLLLEKKKKQRQYIHKVISIIISPKSVTHRHAVHARIC